VTNTVRQYRGMGKTNNIKKYRGRGKDKKCPKIKTKMRL
jgi:hypothetical protein